MNFDDFRKLATSSLLFNLDRVLGPKLVPILYLLGLAGIVLWAVSRLVTGFAFGFDDGLWAILEIVVYGLIWFIVLRVACEAIIVYFKANEHAVDEVSSAVSRVSLIDEVRDAIEELAEEDDKAPPPPPAPARPAAPKPTSAKPAAAVRTSTAATRPRGTAKRSTATTRKVPPKS